MTILLLLTTLSLQQSTPVSVTSTADTQIVVQGLLVKAPTGWLVALPAPIQFRDRAIAELELLGDTSRWYGFNGHYVEARGVLGGEPPAIARRGVFQLNAVREVDPPGMQRKTVSNSWTHRVAVVLWVLPNKIKWRNAQGKPTGVGPAIVYTVNNHGESDLNMTFETKDFVCFSVEPKDGGMPPWSYARQFDQPRDRQRVTLPKFVREVARVPEEAASEPGRYLVRAGLCGFNEYELETEIEVVR